MPQISLHRIALFAWLIFYFQIAQAQGEFTNHYRSADGLASDEIKCITQDSLGFIWIGSDDGLFRYDGLQFTRYAEGAPSNFFKDFFTTSDGVLMGIHDIGITIIHPDVSTPKFDVFLIGSRTLCDSAIFYPKTIFESKDKTLWIAEPNSIVRYKNGNWKRYLFDPEDDTKSFVRSFNFCESDGVLYATSNPGNYFYFDNALDKFIKIPSNEQHVVYDLHSVGNFVLAGTDHGIYRIDLTRHYIKQQKIIIDGVDNNSEYRNIEQLDSITFILSGINDNTAIVKLNNLTGTSNKLVEDEVFVNKSFVDKDGGIWLSSQKGVRLITIPEFHHIRLNKPNNFIEALATNPGSPYIYILRNNSLWKVDKQTEELTKILDGNPDDYYLSAVLVGHTLYAVSGYEVQKIVNDKIVQKISLKGRGRFIFDIVFDPSDSTLWINQESLVGIHQLDPHTLETTTYQSNSGITREIAGFHISENGLYAIANDPDHYLFFKPNGENKFTDISKPFPSNYRVGLAVEGMAIGNEQTWLATNFGLFAVNKDSLTKININANFDNSAVKTVVTENNYLWFASTAGLIRYQPIEKDYAQFTETSGLPVNTVNQECFIIDNNKLWVGTSQGIAVTNYKSDQHSLKTSKPYILEFNANGNTISNTEHHGFEAPFESYITLTFSSMVFPATNVQYSYRLGNSWSAPSTDPTVIFSNLKDGEYTFEVRAKKLGNYSWSDSETIAFTVDPPFYKTAPFYLSIIFVIGAAIFATRFLTARIEKRRQLLLTLLVEERTHELNEIKGNLENMVKLRTEELEASVKQLQEMQNQLIHAEKMASLGVLTAGIAHEINNPVNYLQGGLYSVEAIMQEKEVFQSDKELEEVVNMMKLGIERITNIVKGLSRYSHEGDHSFKDCDMHEVIKTCLIIMKHELKDRIEVQLKLHAADSIIIGDEGSLHQLLINLLSNAVHAINDNGTIIIETNNKPDQLELIISDTGSGIDQSSIDKIFDPFFTTKAPGVGTGLGLYISKKIVTEHQGQIQFQSKKNNGTKVLITFNNISKN